MGSLDGRVGIVTGGGGGIGRAYSLGLAEAGAAVIVADLNLDGASETVSLIEAQGGRAAPVAVDVSDKASTEAMARETIRQFGRIDVLVNNAGIFRSEPHMPFDQIEVHDWDRMFRVNVRGTWLCARAVYPTMREQQYGRIINIASMSIWVGTPNFLQYVAAKSAIIGLTRSLAAEVGQHNIAVNTVAPGYIPHNLGLAPIVNERAVADRIFKRTQTPEDMVGIVVFLAGPGADFITGQSFLVNGGQRFQ